MVNSLNEEGTEQKKKTPGASWYFHIIVEDFRLTVIEKAVLSSIVKSWHVRGAHTSGVKCVEYIILC